MRDKDIFQVCLFIEASLNLHSDKTFAFLLILLLISTHIFILLLSRALLTSGLLLKKGSLFCLVSMGLST